MARNIGPITKKMRRFKLLAESPVEERGKGGNRGRRPKAKSGYGIRLEEKQKLKFLYGLNEKQFRRYFTKAQKDPKNTGIVIMQLLETRLDNIVYRLGFAPTRRAARQIVNHGNASINGQRVDIPSYNVKAGDVVTLSDSILTVPVVVESLNMHKPENLPNWLKREGPIGKLDQMPSADDLQSDIDIQLIIEYYSR